MPRLFNAIGACIRWFVIWHRELPVVLMAISHKVGMPFSYSSLPDTKNLLNPSLKTIFEPKGQTQVDLLEQWRRIMDNQSIAAQLKKPAGKLGVGIGEQMNSFNKEINIRAIGLLELDQDEDILEIGMGNGMFCKEILRCHKSVTYTGCDYSEIMVQEAFLINQEWTENGRAEFHLAEASNLPFPDDYFSRVLTVNTLYFWEDPLKELEEIRRVMTNDGLAVIGIRTRASMIGRPYVNEEFRLFEESDLSCLLQAAGFQEVDTKLERYQANKPHGYPKKLDSLFGLCRK
jgi:SAM-dependent methyltransferase